MRAAQVVELSFGDRGGSGYLLTSRRVLTAKHVINPSKQGAVGEVRALATPDSVDLPLRLAHRPLPWPGHAAWLSAAHDLAIVKLDADPVPGIERLRFGLVPRDELGLYQCCGTGFPAAAGASSHLIEAKLSWVLDDQGFKLDIRTALPKRWKEWAGLSGAVIFSMGLPVGVIRTVKGDWNGLLTATPVQHLIEDPVFGDFWASEGLEKTPDSELITHLQPTMLSQISALVYRIDRRNAVAQILDHLRVLNTPAPPQVIMVPGMDDDEHRRLIQQLSQDPAIQRIMGRAAASDQVIVDLPWPAEEEKIDPARWFDQMLDQLCKRVHVESPPPRQLPQLLGPLRERLNDAVTPRAYWVLVRRAVAIAGHGELLQRLLAFWHSLPPGRPIVLLLCLAWDEPPETKPLMPFLKSRPRQLDPDFDSTINQAVKRRQLTPVEQLPLITEDHIGPWIDEIRQICLSAAPEKFDGLYVSLLSRIGEGKRLRRLSADIGELLPYI